MPIYEYQCAACGERVERLQGLNDPGPESCEACGGAMKRLVSAPAFQFKGTGWYVTDYADRKGQSSDSKGDSTSDSKDSSASSDSKSGADSSAKKSGEKVSTPAGAGAGKSAKSGD